MNPLIPSKIKDFQKQEGYESCLITNLDHKGTVHVIATCEKCGRAIDVYVLKGHFISSATFSGLEKLCRECLSDDARKQMDELLAPYLK